MSCSPDLYSEIGMRSMVEEFLRQKEASVLETQGAGAKTLVSDYMRLNQDKLIGDALQFRKKYKGAGSKPVPAKQPGK